MTALAPSPSMTKTALRTTMRAARKAYVAGLSPQDRRELETELAHHLRAIVEAAGEVGAYHATGSEINPSSALTHASSPSLPAFDAGQDGFRFRLGPATVAGTHGIPEPDPASPLANCKLVLVPLLAVDAGGHRLGQGGGHYDRALPALRNAGARLVGIGWDMQKLQFALPSEPWDVPLDGFASPAGLEWF